ncbi:prolyl oligopeptidase family serine peptidase [Rubrivivax benzoatilyticus]|uniref:prolyl oligopeptidase n=1 Tax=Rubrivivax benzoatilyticus TaxID=316997 RepID=A0ABX0I0A2_9BURK|nr:prolyl oligopeptidase family serine peptidase [Rubrivivax benzoatilyticus]EGJ09219.1 prolyl oligopeptidase [Rubrivivax benzoatilyticus JA2 = ATCC BAA-35]NHL00022.1 S9 family peptidase [Rubrivivax benzoatilyticus]NHL25962.1 S9 family peptidase [Rubrivivax benzoatilyticus]
MIRLLLSAASLLVAVAAPASPAKAPDAGSPRPVVEALHGIEVTDPFRHLENVRDPAVAAWMRARSREARRTLDKIPGRAAMASDVARLMADAGTRLGEVQRRPGGRLFYEKRGARDDQFRLYLRQGGRERLLVDPQALGRPRGTPHAIDYFVASPQGRYVAFGLSAGGSEDARLHVVDTRSGRRVLGPVERAQYGNVAWLDDESGFFFTRLRAPAADAAPADKYAGSRAVFVRLGADPEHAPVALSFESPGVAIDEAQDSPSVLPVPGTRWALGLVSHGTDRELAVWVAPLADAVAGTARWRPAFGREAGVTALETAGERLFLLSHLGAPRSRLLETSVAAPDPAGARVLVPEGEGVLTGLARGADALYLRRRDGSASSLLRLPLDGGAAPTEVALPLRGAFEFAGADPGLPGVMLALQGWTEPERLWSVAPGADGAVTVTDTRLLRPGRMPAAGRYVVREVLVPGHDGVRVPLAIVHRAGLKLDGRAPALLWGYASYGMTDEPWFSATRLAWLDRGGVFAVANPRGSGAFGQDWYRGGLRETKPNSWKDFIATAEYLVAEGYTTPARLGAWGASAGGVLVGRAITERPDLFGAAVLSVGALDMVRAELEPNGPPNIPEFGSVATADGLRALLAMSSYHQVRDGVRYPAVLLTHGVNDARVEVWQSLKMAARLRQATASGKPVLLRLDYAGGHGGGATRAQQAAETADIYAFLRWQATGSAR